MASSAIISRLSSVRLKVFPLKLKSNKSVLPTVSPLKSSFQSQVSSPVNHISGISSGAKLLNVNDAITQCNCFGSPQIVSCHGISELGFDFSRYLYAFITVSLGLWLIFFLSKWSVVPFCT